MSQNVPCSLPDTQDADGLTQSQERASQQQTLFTWGMLCPLRTSLKGLEMTRNVYTVGRSQNCDLTITLEEMQEKWWNVISKVHFRIYRERIGNTNEIVVYLEDMSQNGTFVDQTLVGRGNRVIIENDSEIALSKPIFSVYTFTSLIMPERNYLPLIMKQKYALGRKLGAGACGEVRLIFTKNGTGRFAMKTIKKQNLNTNLCTYPLSNSININNEVAILKRLRHSCIIQMEEIYDTPDAIHIVLEWMKGGELFERIRNRGSLTESCAKLIFYQVVLAVHYLHKEGITHRDLKPENILLATASDITLAKVSDFGLSKLVDTHTMMKTFCGTPMYVAPEILATNGRNSYTSQVDVWSLGVILYACLGGVVPFNIRNGNYTLDEQIRRGLYSFPLLHFGHVSQQAIDLIKRMMTVNPKKRITISQILLHPWLRDSRMREIVNSLISNENDENVPPLNINNNHEDNPGYTKRARLNA